MRLFRLPRKGQIRRVELAFDPDTDLRYAIESSIRLARLFSDSLCSCRVEMLLDGIDIEVGEFSNSEDLMRYFAVRRRLRQVGAGCADPA